MGGHVLCICRILIIVQRCVFFYFFVCLLGMFVTRCFECVCVRVGLSTPLLTSSGFVFWLCYRLRAPSVWVSGRWWGGVWERGKWAVYEEGGDRAIMGEEVNSLYSVFFFSGCGGGGGEAFR